MDPRQPTHIRAITRLPIALAAMLGALSFAATRADGLQTLYSFTGGADGLWPGELTIAGSKLYGVTAEGGGDNYGTVFSEFVGGGPVTTLYRFTGGNDGADPAGGLALAGSILYGTTLGAGHGGYGTIFSEFIGGGPVNTLYSFTGGTDGVAPNGTMALAGSVLYGATGGGNGGASSSGTLFSEFIGGGSPTTLYAFSSGGNDGATPVGGMALAGSILYGTTANGGANGNGTIFSEFIGGGPVNTLYSFAGGNDGGTPTAGLTIVGSMVYGTTSTGGANGGGTVFSEFIGGGSPTTLHAFGATNDGTDPVAGVTIAGSHIFGTTTDGGAYGFGAVFKMGLDGSNYQVIHSFTNAEGNYPAGNLVLAGSNLYGTTLDGGAMVTARSSSCRSQFREMQTSTGL